LFLCQLTHFPHHVQHQDMLHHGYSPSHRTKSLIWEAGPTCDVQDACPTHQLEDIWNQVRQKEQETWISLSID
jgi:hypothetical protein